QAEDGIRDFHVTGVQTCALPIYTDLYKREPFELVLAPNSRNSLNVPLKIKMLNENEYEVSAKGETNLNGYQESFKFKEVVRFGRSEERRVGKECRSRWTPKHEKR